MVFPVSVYFSILFDLINVLLSHSFVFILLCGAFIVLVLVFLSGLSSATLLLPSSTASFGRHPTEGGCAGGD